MSELITIRLYEIPELPRFAQGGLARTAESVRQAGRGGDEILIHINPEEFRQLQGLWGEPSINPRTGLPEYGFFSKLWKKAKKIVKKIAPYAGILASVFVPGLAPAIGAALGASGTAATMLGNAVIGGVSGGISGGGRGALAGALTGGLSGSGGTVGKALGLSGNLANVVGSGLIRGGAAAVTGGDVGKSALIGAAGAAAQPYLQSFMKNAGTRSNVMQDTDTGGLDEVEVTAQRLPEMVDGAPITPIATPDLQATAANVPQINEPGYLEQLYRKGIDYAKEHPIKTGMGALTLMQNMGAKPPEQAAPPEMPEWMNQPLPQYEMQREQTTPQVSYYNYGTVPPPLWEDQGEDEDEEAFPITPPMTAATGGYAAGGSGALSQASRYVRGNTGANGRQDNIEALLSENEYVIDAETVALLGDGNPDAGAKMLDQMRANVRKHKGAALSRGKISPNARSPLAYLQGAR
jgi:hypothetical protein